MYRTGNVDLAYHKSQQATQCRNIGIAIFIVGLIFQIVSAALASLM